MGKLRTKRQNPKTLAKSTSRARPRNATGSNPTTYPSLSDLDVARLRTELKKMLKGREPKPFQVDMARAQLEHRCAMLQAATGSGKTAVAAAPYALAENKDRITFMVSPLIGLMDEMVDTFKEDFGLPAIAINSSHGGLSPENAAEIRSGKYRIILASPEMMLSSKFSKDVMSHPDVRRRVLAVVIDEAHCISHWGASFRKKYSELGRLRIQLPPGTPFIAVSASITPRVRREIARVLHFPQLYQYANLGNERYNVSVIVRAIHNHMNTYTDLDFIVPDGVKSLDDLKKVWIYADNIETGAEIIDYLRTRLPQNLHAAIRPYNAVHSSEYRKKAMSEFRKGNIRILVCTDAAGMGCDVRDIDMVVQWKLPEKLSSFVQRAGRAARDHTRIGVAILLVEPSAYNERLPIKLGQPASTTKKTRAKKGETVKEKSAEEKKAARAKAAETTKYAAEHGRNRGTRKGGPADSVIPCAQPELDPNDDKEGLVHFVQATTCRRRIWRDVFKCPEDSTVDKARCCDICNPALLDCARPGPKPTASPHTRVTYHDEAFEPVLKAIRQWRSTTHKGSALYRAVAASAFLPSDYIDKLSRLRKPTKETVQNFLQPQWPWWQEHSESITTVILNAYETLEERQTALEAASPDDAIGGEAAVFETQTQQFDMLQDIVGGTSYRARAKELTPAAVAAQMQARADEHRAKRRLHPVDNYPDVGTTASRGDDHRNKRVRLTPIQQTPNGTGTHRHHGVHLGAPNSRELPKGRINVAPPMYATRVPNLANHPHPPEQHLLQHVVGAGASSWQRVGIVSTGRQDEPEAMRFYAQSMPPPPLPASHIRMPSTPLPRGYATPATAQRGQLVGGGNRARSAHMRTDSFPQQLFAAREEHLCDARIFHPTPIRASSAGSNLTCLTRGALSESRAPTRRGRPFEQDGFRPAPQLLAALAQLRVPFTPTEAPARPRGTSSGTPRLNALMPTMFSTPHQPPVPPLRSNAGTYPAMLPPVATPVQTPRKRTQFLPISSMPSTPQPPYSPEYIDYTLVSPPTNYYFPDFLQ